MAQRYVNSKLGDVEIIK